MKEMLQPILYASINPPGDQPLTLPSSTAYPRGGVVMEASGDMLPNQEQTQAANPPVKAEGKHPQPAQAETETIPPGVRTAQTEKPVSPEKIVAARQASEKANQGKVLAPEEQEAIEKLIEKGILPIGGGAGLLRIMDFGSRLAQEAVKELLNDINISAGQPRINTLRDHLQNVRNLRNLNRIPEDEATRIINNIYEWLEEAENREKLERQQTAEAERRTEEEESRERQRVINMLIDRNKRNEEFNDLFAAVDATPHEFFETVFNPLTYGARYERFMDLIRMGSIGRFPEGFAIGRAPQELDKIKQDLTQDFARYQTERRVRQTLHNANAVIYLPSVKAEDLYKYLQQFSSELGDAAYKMPGAREMMNLYEMMLRQDMVKNNGYLRPEAVLGKVQTAATPDGKTIIAVDRGEVEIETKSQFRRLLSQGKIFIRKSDRSPMELNPNDVPSWEVDRIFTIARGMMIVSQRLLSLAAESKLPKGKVARFTSLFLQDALQSYAPYIHLLSKYGITESGLAAYLYQEDRKKVFGTFTRPWSINELKKVYEIFKDGPLSILDGAVSETIHIRRLNPNRAGDIFTWLSWRVDEDPEVVSMSQEFIKKGRTRMEARARDHGYLPDEDYLNEYANWIGTGLRLERLRGNLAKLRKDDKRQEKKMAAAKAKAKKERNPAEEDLADVYDAKEKAEKIIQRMVELQPGRLYFISEKIRGRIQALLVDNARNPYSQEDIDQILRDLALVETNLFSQREALLDEGRTFHQKEINGVDRAITLDFSVITDAATRARAEKFAEIIKKDFNNAQTKQEYWDEFIYRREYNHGFVLWSGDAPVDEFDAAALGPTGAFVRRARDNQAQSEAAVEEIKLLASLKKVKKPEEALELLTPIYDKIAAYDPGKAKQAIFEKAHGITKFYLVDFMGEVPLVGGLFKLLGRGSFAQIVYGRRATIWHSNDARHLFNLLKERTMITEEQYRILETETLSRGKDVVLDAAVTMAQLLAIAFVIYMISRLSKEK